MKKLRTILTFTLLIMLATACVQKSNVKEILNDKELRKKIELKISQNHEMSKEIIPLLIKSNQSKKQMADNPDLQKFMNKDEYHKHCPSGKFIKFYPDGTPKETGTFRRYKFCDTLRRFHANGEIEYEAIFNEKGNEQGDVKYYYPNGQEEFVYQTKNGVPHGEASRFLENGDIKETIYYSANGQIMRLIRHQK